jgi:hypothetical protein
MNVIRIDCLKSFYFNVLLFNYYWGRNGKHILSLYFYGFDFTFLYDCSLIINQSGFDA